MAEITWNHLVDGDFSDAADWRGGVVPGASDDAVLGSGGAPYTVTSTADETVNSIQTSAPVTLSISGGVFTAENGTGTGVNGGVVSVRGGTLSFGGTIDNAGTISLSGATSYLVVGDAGGTLSGGGTVKFSPTSGSFVTGGPLTNVDNDIVGSFSIKSSLFENQVNGTIDATGNSNVDADGGTVVNLGLIEATNSHEMDIIYSTLDNSGGEIVGGDNSIVGIFECTLEGGTLTSQSSGEIEAGTSFSARENPPPTIFDGSIESILNDATVVVSNNLRLILEGDIQNAGLFQADSTGSDTEIDVGAEGLTLSGGGDITLSDSAENYMRSATSAPQALTNLDNTLSGAGSLGLGTLALDNDSAAVIDATGTYALVVDTGTNAFANAGLVEASGNGGLVLRSSTVANTGTISSQTGSKVTLQASDVEGGTFETSGTGVIQVLGAGNTIDGETSGIEIAGKMVVLTGASLTGTGVVVLSDALTAKGDASLGGVLINNGTLEVAGGSMSVAGAVSGTGEAVIDGGSVSFGSTFSQEVAFDGGGELILADSQAYAATVWRFSTSGATSLDLQDIAFTGATATYSGTTGQGVLTVTSGADVAHITFKGDYLGTTFTLSEDADGGTIVTDNAAAPAVATIAQAIAAFAPAQAASASVTHAAEHRAPAMLSRPGTSVT